MGRTGIEPVTLGLTTEAPGSLLRSRVSTVVQSSVVHAEVTSETEPRAADASRRVIALRAHSWTLTGGGRPFVWPGIRAWLCCDASGDGSAIGFGFLNP